ncbi:MAG TPA: T9SS type A sorting domain-containing protein, partial [Bacteroidales bacterium]|nr:T9SS type A sorting domain-containing protein [Bacteroidales bacterium]
PGVVVQQGGHLLAYISNTYCVNPTPLVAVKDTEVLPGQEYDPAGKGVSFFKVYPNPTLGLFTLELDEPGTLVFVEIYTMLGEQIVNKDISGLRKYEFDLSTQSNAVFIIRVLKGETIGFERIIKQ